MKKRSYLAVLLALGMLAVPAAGCEKQCTEHEYGGWEEVTVPTCLSEGLERQICTVCGYQNERKIKALGHDWDEGEVTVAPTEEREGELTKHCKRGCGATDVSAIAKLDPVEELFYQFRTVRTDGSRLTVDNVILLITPKSGGKTETLILSGNQTGMYLKAGTYVVTADNLPEGYSTKAEGYEVSADDPTCKIVLTASLIPEPAAGGTRYEEGSVMHDFTVQTTDGEVRLGEILGSGKAVVLNFWATWCGPCRSEFPYLEGVYHKYKDSVEVLAIDVDASESLAEIGQFMSVRGLTFCACTDAGLGLYDRFGFSTIPLTVAIDREGVVIEVHSGSSDQAYFEGLFSRL